MKLEKILQRLIVSVLACVYVSGAWAASSSAPKPGEWWNIPYPSTFDSSLLAKKQDFIKVKGHRFVDEDGKTFIFRGVNIADPDKLAKQGQWNKKLFKEIKSWGGNVIRLPIHPVAWRERGKHNYFKLIDEAVVWANALDFYLIIDWHSIGYLPNEMYQHEMYDTTRKETYTFWRDITFRYKGVSTIAFYEIFNEPTTQGGALGERNWAEWKALNEKIIDMIYARDKSVIPLVAGFNWTYDLSYVKKAPIEREGIAYVAHPYPTKAKPKVKNTKNYFKLWEETWGYVAKKYPVVATEWGWVKSDGYGAHVPTIHDEGEYGPRLVKFMEERGISWTMWVFDVDWSPRMIEDWNFTPSEQGAFYKEIFQSK